MEIEPNLIFDFGEDSRGTVMNLSVNPAFWDVLTSPTPW